MSVRHGSRLVSAGVLPRARTPRDGEKLIRERLEHLHGDDVVVIDAPLTLPPLLRESRTQLGGSGAAARLVEEMWVAGWHPVTARECEYLQVKGGRPRPGATMRLGMIAARAIVLAAELRSRGVIVLETYPRSVKWCLDRLEPDSGWSGSSTLGKALRASSRLTTPPEIDLESASGDALDAVLCVITGTAYIEGATDPPPRGLDEVRDGWIRLPSVPPRPLSPAT